MKKRGTHLITHGLTGHPLLGIWHAIKYRCYNPKDPSYKHYGARGVIMCDEWKDNFVTFYTWCIANGWRKGVDLDKDIKAKELGVEALLYSPERCQFVTRKTNTRNSRRNHIIEYKGEKKILEEWSEILGIKRDTLLARLNKQKMSVEEAFTKKVGKQRAVRQFTLDWEFVKDYPSITIAAKETGIHIGSICQHLSGDSIYAGKFKWKYI